MEFTKSKTQGQNEIKAFHLHITSYQTRGSQVPVIAHLVFNLTSKVDRKWGCYT
jgi:formylmethanofuran dehydrogenase subunit E